MIKNYLKVAIRNLLKRKGFTLINILGLAIGMAVCMLIVLFIRSELGYDSFQPDVDRVYRVVLDRKYPGRTTSYAEIPNSIGEAIHKEFPEVEAHTIFLDFSNQGNVFVKSGDQLFEEQHVLAADSNFFRIFPSFFLEGDSVTALQRPNTVVLTERTAKKIFGSSAGAQGKVLEIEGNGRFTISAVCKDLPDNSHMAYDLLVSASTFPFLKQPNYTGFNAYTYLLLRPNSSAANLEAKLPRIVEKYVSGDISRNFGMSYAQFLAAGNGYHYYLQPLPKIHLISDLEAELRPNGSQRAITIFGIIAIFILGIACINFINLSTARSVERAKEVGIRKTYGSEKKSLIFQFLLESTLVSFCAVIIALLLVWALLPLFNQVSGKELSLWSSLTAVNCLILLAAGLLVGALAGVYPALILSSFQPIQVLKGKFKSNKYGTALRNGLVIFQFAISIILIICTLVVNRQMNYMLGDQLGFQKDHIIQIERTDLVDKQAMAFRNELAGIAGVEKVSGASNLPGAAIFRGISFQVQNAKESVTGRGLFTDDRFAATLGLQLAEGRYFSRAFSTDSLSIILNERAVEALGLKEPVIGTRLTTPDGDLNKPDGSPNVYTVIGVIKDFHYQNLHQSIAPLFIIDNSRFNDVGAVTAVRIKGDHFQSAVRDIEQTWKHFVQERPFHYSFLDQRLADQYKAEQTIQKIFTVFSVLAIFIGCIGLLGLAAYATQQRIREISIRKILGASIGGIVGMLSIGFLRLVTIAALVAFPIAWMAMHAWLSGFVYRITISWWIFVLAWALSLIISLLTICFQALRAARANPVKILRSE